MTFDRSHLIPEQRIDRNGRASTRWVKPATHTTSLPLKAPAPVLTGITTKRTTLSRISRIEEITGVSRNHNILAHWIGKANKRELGVIDSALEVFDKDDTDVAVAREQKVIKSILHSLARGSSTEDEVVLEMLALRKAFCSEWSQENDPQIMNAELKSYIYGIRGNKPLLLDKDDKWVTGLTAAIRFAYEMNARCPEEDFLPTVEADSSIGFSSVRTTRREFVTPDLANLAYQESAKTTELIELAITNRTNDAAVLRSLLENPDGAKPLANGWL